MARRTPSIFGAGLLAWGIALTVLGGAATLAIALGFDPANADKITRDAMTFAFATAQLGLSLLALRVFWSLYQRAAALATRPRR